MPDADKLQQTEETQSIAEPSYREFFRELSDFYPFPYQERLQQKLSAGNSVILRVPTGAGKTWAAVAPFLHSLTNGQQQIADRLLYALPLRSLATSLHASVLAGMTKVFSKVQNSSSNREYSGKTRYCSLQIGGEKNDPFFESDLVFTTIDQLLSGYLLMPVSLPDRVGNINAGALIGSIIVFDELHLLDPEVALGTVIEMLDRLHGLCQFVLMTATASNSTLDQLADRLDAKVLEVPDDEIRALPSQRTKQRTWRRRDEKISAATVVEKHNGGRTVVLLNTVKRAQDLFVELKNAYTNRIDAPTLMLLHSRFYPEDRKRVEDQLEPFFGPKPTQNNVILVTTQVIEAGIDISADVLHSELAPMNALIQRAGRTARYEHRSIGEFAIYEAAGRAPYHESDEASLVNKTREMLESLPPPGRMIDFTEEREWIEAVHSPSEEKYLRRYLNLTQRRDEVHLAMDDGDRGRLSSLVRDIDSVSVVIASNPDALFDGRRWPKMLSVPSISLLRLRECFKALPKGDWVAKGAREDSEDERPGLRIKWESLTDKQLRAQWLVAIHPNFASYSKEIGLRLAEAGPEPPQSFTPVAKWQSYSYDFETWEDHARRVLRSARRMEPAYLRATRLLAKQHETTENSIKELVDIVCLLHDIGKLAEDWQAAAWKWQDDKDKRARETGALVPTRDRVPIAHTWFESETDWQLKKNYPFPPHAVQGAFAIYEALPGKLGECSSLDWGRLATPSAATAIARHHGTHTRSCTNFRLAPGSRQLVATALGALPNDLSLRNCQSHLMRDAFPDELLSFGVGNDGSHFPLYAFLCRRLRLADQSATADQKNPL